MSGFEDCCLQVCSPTFWSAVYCSSSSASSYTSVMSVCVRVCACGCPPNSCSVWLDRQCLIPFGHCMQVGGVPAVLKYLLQKGFLHGNCMTVTGGVPRAGPMPGLHACPMLAPCLPHVCPTLAPCLPHACPMSAPRLPHVCPTLAPCLLCACSMPAHASPCPQCVSQCVLHCTCSCYNVRHCVHIHQQRCFDKCS